MRKGITRRWMVNGFAVIVGFLVIVEIAFMVAVRSYYYQGVETALSNRAETYRNSVSMSVAFSNLSAGTVDLSQRAQELVERFNNKEKMELQVLDKTGAALISSTGFVPAIDLNMEDFKRALQAGSNDRGVWTGKNANRENVMAYTLLERDQNGNVIGALRYVVSLTLVDRQVWILVGVMLLFGVVIVFFVALSSSYFISSIVNPVTEIGRAARRIALGEYDFRIEKKYDDEIGELCDTLNYMAGEIDTAERMKNDFISSVSHELRTPLTAIKGWSETLRQVGPDDTEMMEKGLDVIAGEAERLSGIVEELLDFSRMQSGHLMMKFGRTDVVAELEEAVFLFRDRAEKSGIAMQYVEAPDIQPVLGDRDRLKQVFINVLDNAFKYSNAGGKVRVEAADLGGHVLSVVSDTGVGISKEDLPNIKNKFYKANKTRPGSGIGLALADEIIRRHKGRLDIESEEGVGTTVIITLPVAPPDAPALS